MQEHILVIEENAIQLRKLREILSREGFSIITVSDKESALNITQKLNVKYILASCDALGCSEKNLEIK
jgi:PleD family two-component response regulator